MSDQKAKELIKDDGLGKVIGSLGSEFPIITINNYTFSVQELESLTISLNEWLPTCNLSVNLTSGIFITRHLPKDGDVISVFIRSENNLFKPIKNDYLITDMGSSPSYDAEGNVMNFIFNGILRVPNLYADESKTYKKLTSYEVLLDIANTTGLGFVTNETSTDDKMNWLCANVNKPVFIQDVVKHSYKDDKSFFDSWVDYYYNLNFVNVNKVLSVSDNIENLDGIYQGVMKTDYSNDKAAFEKETLMLTNSSEATHTTMYFKNFQVTNRSGLLSTTYGYKNEISFFDKAIDELVKFNIDPFRTENSEKTKIVMMGRKNEDYYKKDIKTKWLGFQHSLPDDNVHSFYKLAYMQNHYNNLESTRITLNLELPKCNFNLYKGMSIPIIFFVSNDPNRAKFSGNEEDKGKERQFTIDRSLSGNYYIKNINILFKKEIIQASKQENDKTIKREYKVQISQSVTVTRREWTVQNQRKEDVLNETNS